MGVQILALSRVQRASADEATMSGCKKERQLLNYDIYRDASKNNRYQVSNTMSNIMCTCICSAYIYTYVYRHICLMYDVSCIIYDRSYIISYVPDLMSVMSQNFSFLSDMDDSFHKDPPRRIAPEKRTQDTQDSRH